MNNKTRKRVISSFAKCAAVLTLCVLLVACGGGGGGGGGGAAPATSGFQSNYATVTPQSVAGKTFTASDGSTVTFNASGNGGTIGTITFTFDGDVVTDTSSGKKYYLRNTSGRHYLFPGQLRNSSGSGEFGKWVWTSGTTPADFYDYYKMFSPNIFQNPRFEANNDTSVTYVISGGVLTLYHNGALYTSEYALYDGTYLYPIVLSF